MIRPFRPHRLLFCFVAVVIPAIAWTSPSWAVPCNVPADCDTGFCVEHLCCDTACTGACEACTAAKTGGADGTCAVMPSGSVCEEPHCDGASFSFVDTSFCDRVGVCVAPAGVPCLHDDPCHFDLCGGDGCTQVTKTDGTECADGVCTDGKCGPPMATASSSGGGGAGAGGAGAGASGGGGATTGSSQDTIYPPAEDGACGCRAGSGTPAGGTAAIAMAILALVRRRLRSGGEASGRSRSIA